MNRNIFFITSITIFFLLLNLDGIGQPKITICGPGKNDIVKILRDNSYSYCLYDDPLNAVVAAPYKGGVLFLSEAYPKGRLKLADTIFQLAKQKHLRLYIEYPQNIPGIKIADTTIYTRLERGIIYTHDIPGLDSLNLLGIHNSFVIPIKGGQPLIVTGKVAGFDKAVYGLSDVKTFPLLMEKDNLLIAATRISSFITARFGPVKSWKKIWYYIFNWLQPDVDWNFGNWPLQVEPMYGAHDNIPIHSIDEAIKRGSDWFYKARFFVDSTWLQMFLRQTGDGTNVVGPSVPDSFPVGNGSLGILEGHVSQIFMDGSQPYRWWNRSDDQAGVAYSLALAGRLLKQPTYLETAGNLLDYLFVTSNLRGGPRDDKESPTFGLVGWATTYPTAYYGDDNARVILGAIGASVALRSDKWIDYIIQATLSNFRTAGIKGFRGKYLLDSVIQSKGWKYFSNRDIINIHPHYEAWLWACYLWLYDKTGYKPLLNRAKTAIRITMDNFSDWKWTNSMQDERARMILPLAWLVRIEDTEKHRKWLNQVSNTLLADLQDCGAIREELGPMRNGSYKPPSSNTDYGTSEAPLIFENGDPVTDLLYTESFAFFALNEAYHATHDSVYYKAVQQMCDFLVRIQVRSKEHPDLDGAWFRAFDYQQWDYWASNADADWGAWCTQTGWIQTWILSTLVFVKQNQSFWNYTESMNNEKEFVEKSHVLIDQMLLQ